MVGVLFVKLEDFLDYEKRLIELPIEPFGTLYIEVSFCLTSESIPSCGIA